MQKKRQTRLAFCSYVCDCCCKHNILNLHIYGLCALAWQAEFEKQ